MEQELVVVGLGLGSASFLAVAIGFIVSVTLTPAVRALAIRTGNIDRPIGLKIHKMATPRMGGLAVYVAFAVATIVVLPWSAPVAGLICGGLAAVILGVADEYCTLSPLVHLGGQVGAALVAIVSGVGIIQSVSNPFSRLTEHGFSIPFALALPLTIFWLVGMINTVNFLDGLDGLATGVATLAALLLAAWAWEAQGTFFPVTAHHEDLLLPLALVGALCGFLPYNWHTARIFLGDSGSVFLGLALAALSIVGPTKLGTALLILILPALDVAWAIVRRQLRGRSFLSGDKQHVYHRMMELGMGHTATVVTLYGVCAALGVLDLLLVKVQKLAAFVVLAMLLSGAFVFIELRASARATVRDAEPSQTPSTQNRR